MSGAALILRALASGPKTNRELQEATGFDGCVVAGTMADLIKRRHAQRIDGGNGRGSFAVYAIIDHSIPNYRKPDRPATGRQFGGRKAISINMDAELFDRLALVAWEQNKTFSQYIVELAVAGFEVEQVLP